MLRDFLLAMARWILAAVVTYIVLALDVWDRWIGPSVAEPWRGIVEGVGSVFLPFLPALIILAGAFLVYRDQRREAESRMLTSGLIEIRPDAVRLPGTASPEQIAAAGSAVANFTAGTAPAGRTFPYTLDEPHFARRVADAERARILAALPAALNTTILRKSFPMDPFALAADLVTAIEKQQEAHQ